MPGTTPSAASGPKNPVVGNSSQSRQDSAAGRTNATPNYTASTVPSQPASQSLVDMTPVAGSSSSYTAGAQKVDSKQYQTTIYDSYSDDYDCNYSSSPYPNQATYELDHRYKKFHTIIGLADSSSSGDTATFTVLIDGQAKGIKPTLQAGQTEAIDLSVAGAFRITLQDTCSSPAQYSGLGGTVTAVWADPEVSS